MRAYNDKTYTYRIESKFLSFYPNIPTSPKAGDVSAAARKGREKLANTHQNKCPKGQINRAPRSGAIAKNAISPPWVGGRKSR